MKSSKPLFIFEMANNHQGSVDHGKKIIRALKEACHEYTDKFEFAVKFQFRDLDTFIHPSFKDRLDIKNVKRFQDTKLTMKEFSELLYEVRENGFTAICTPFDEVSVDNIVSLGFDYIKIASCSFGDWPLLEKIASVQMPVIASAAGSDIELVDKVVSFFEHRRINLSLMHCVAEYPTVVDKLQMNQIDFYHSRYPNLRIGFSTHESPDNIIPVIAAISKGALIFEKHVGLSTESITLNGYSANPEQVKLWLAAAAEAFDMCGVVGERYKSTYKEQADLAALQRGVFVRSDQLEVGKISRDDLYFAFPCQDEQLLASHLSKYIDVYLKNGSLSKDAPVMLKDIDMKNNVDYVREFVSAVMELLKESNIVIPADSSCELSHHYGIENFRKTGCALIDCINREYCKKIIVVLPGQMNPTHYHIQKEETFLVISGNLTIGQDEIEKVYHKGDMVIVNRGVKHYFRSETGCVFEEISTTHHGVDSFYETPEEFISPRKTKVFITKEMIESLK